jgi:hypothetical protein
MSGPDETQIDWSLTTFDGARREQLRRWAELPLEQILTALEEMEALSTLSERKKETPPDIKKLGSVLLF